MKELFSDDEWQLMQYSVLWMFQSIAYADTVIEEEEINAMKQLQKISDRFQSKLMQEILQSINFSDEDYLNVYNHKARVRTGLFEVANIIDEKLTSEESLLFKKSLLSAAIYIAKSSGLNGERYISFEETKAIKELSYLINITPIDLSKQPILNELIANLENE